VAAGYRHLDLAWRYGYVAAPMYGKGMKANRIRNMNETAMGEGIRQSGITREELFLTDKLWQTWHGRAEEVLNNSLEELRVEYLGLWLMHWYA
jgi:diketogulonate reductase-like aldo/keto reductase